MFLGELAALGSAAGWAASSTLVKNSRGRIGALSISAVRSLTGAATAVLVAATAGHLLLIGQIPPGSVAILLASSLATMAGDVMFVRGIMADNISRVFPTVTSLYILFSVVASAIFADQQITPLTVLGGFFVLIGVYLTAGRESNEAADAKKGRGLSWQALGFSVGAALLWTVSLMGIDHGLKDADPLAATAMRNMFIAIGLFLLATLTGSLRRQPWSRQDLRNLLLSGVGWGMSSVLFIVALKLSSPGTVAILSSSSPIFVVLIAYLFLHERITLRVGGGTAICLLGVYLTI